MAPEGALLYILQWSEGKKCKRVADALEVLSDDIFNHHVTFDRKTFQIGLLTYSGMRNLHSPLQVSKIRKILG
jgi:hypothetical protein